MAQGIEGREHRSDGSGGEGREHRSDGPGERGGSTALMAQGERGGSTAAGAATQGSAQRTVPLPDRNCEESSLSYA